MTDGRSPIRSLPKTRLNTGYRGKIRMKGKAGVSTVHICLFGGADAGGLWNFDSSLVIRYFRISQVFFRSGYEIRNLFRISQVFSPPASWPLRLRNAEEAGRHGNTSRAPRVCRRQHLTLRSPALPSSQLRPEGGPCLANAQPPPRVVQVRIVATCSCT